METESRPCGQGQGWRGLARASAVSLHQCVLQGWPALDCTPVETLCPRIDSVTGRRELLLHARPLPITAFSEPRPEIAGAGPAGTGGGRAGGSLGDSHPQTGGFTMPRTPPDLPRAQQRPPTPAPVQAGEGPRVGGQPCLQPVLSAWCCGVLPGPGG